MAWITTFLSIDFSRATASAICSNSSRLAATPMAMSFAPVFLRFVIPVRATNFVQRSMRSFRFLQFPCLQAFPDQPVGEHQLGFRDIRGGKTQAAGFGLVA